MFVTRTISTMDKAVNSKRVTRTSCKVETAEEKPKLSEFKPKEKGKLTAAKRNHLKVDYDENSPTPQEHKSSSKIDKQQPDNWETVLNNLRQMRSKSDAPVDFMGCDACPDKEATPKDRRLQSLISLMLSSQTKDQVTYSAMIKLKEYGCNLQSLIDVDESKLGELIYPTKVKYIKKSAIMIRDEFNGDIPNTVEDLCKLPGVGPKMAHLCMKTAWGQITGIGVDTHVHRITNRLKWVNTKTPEQTRKELEAWLPFELWSEVNHLLVGFGQQICLPVKPQCANCLNKHICPFGAKEIKSARSKK